MPRIIGPDGKPVPTPAPCYDCACCAEFNEALEVLAGNIRDHLAGEVRIAPCTPECMICAAVDWQRRDVREGLGGSAG
jgi:hypothetical protein